MKKSTRITLLVAVFIILIAAFWLLIVPHSLRAANDTQLIATNIESTQPALPTHDELLTLVNAERTKTGVASLKVDERLNESAQRKADDEVKYDYFDHVSPSDGRHGYTYAYDTGIKCSFVSENLHFGTGNFTTARATIEGWLKSKAHREAMLDSKYSLTGFGVALMKDNKTVTVVEHFCEE